MVLCALGVLRSWLSLPVPDFCLFELLSCIALSYFTPTELRSSLAT